MRTILVVSFRHSGSTVVGDLLGTADGALYVGESSRALVRLAKGGNCSCGRPLQECPVLGIPSVSPGTADTAVLGRASDPARSIIPFLFASLRGKPTRLPADLRTAAVVQRAVLARERPGVQVVVDSSKSLPLAANLAHDPRFDTTIVYVRRDVRDVVNSCQRSASVKRLRTAGRLRRELSAAMDGIRWWLTGLYVRRALVRSGVSVVDVYLDEWALDHDSAVRSLGDALGLSLPAGDYAISLGERHVVWGNSGRQSSTDVRIRAPRRTRERLTPTMRMVLGAIAAVDVWPGPGESGVTMLGQPSPQVPSDG